MQNKYLTIAKREKEAIKILEPYLHKQPGQTNSEDLAWLYLNYATDNQYDNNRKIAELYFKKAIATTEKLLMNEDLAHRKRKAYKYQMMLISSTILFASMLLIMSRFFASSFFEFINIELVLGVIGILASFIISYRTSEKVKTEKVQDERQIMMRELESEIKRYKTLIQTDPRINEYIRNKESN